MDTAAHATEVSTPTRDWVPSLTLAFMFAIQTAVVIWWASELSTNQKHIQSDLAKLGTDLSIMKDREQKYMELSFYVTELKRRVAKIENDPMP